MDLPGARVIQDHISLRSACYLTADSKLFWLTWKRSGPFLTSADKLLRNCNTPQAEPSLAHPSPESQTSPFLGQACKALLVATEAVVRIPIPPGRIQLHRTIAFLDKRLVLRGLDWRIAERGLLDLEELVDSLQEGVPQGYAVSVTGAPTTLRLGRTFLRIDNGTLLTVRYTEDALDSDDTSAHESSSHPDNGPDDGSEEAEDEDSPAPDQGPICCH